MCNGENEGDSKATDPKVPNNGENQPHLHFLQSKPLEDLGAPRVSPLSHTSKPSNKQFTQQINQKANICDILWIPLNL